MINKKISTQLFKNALIVLLCFCSNFIFGAIEHTIISKTGAGITSSSPNNILQIQDQWFSYMSANTVNNATFNAVAGNENVVLRFDQSKLNNFVSTFTFSVKLKIELYGVTGGATTMYRSLDINYNNSSSYKDKDFVRFSNTYYKCKVTIDSTFYNSVYNTVPPASFLNDMYLDLEQETERYYKIISTSIPFVYEKAVVDNQLPIAWTYAQGAESYDVEWVLVDIGTGNFSPGYPIDFRDATRVNTFNQYYNISLAYPRGILMYRVRGVGYDPSTGEFVLGPWSYNDGAVLGNTSTTPTPPTMAYRYQYSGLDTTYNWQYNATYAENGKRKEVVGYFDGSLRNRQTATILNTDNNAVLAETKYDFEGRGAVQMMPTPLTSTGIHYYSNFDDYFDKNDFDKDTKYNTPGSVSSSNVTQVYYSNNTSSTGSDAYTPDAEGYPYTRTRYKKDGTDRITKQSGLGASQKIGSTHETGYFYGTPTGQQELDRLFGNEAGNWLHYKKNMVVDANGQVSISYLDQEGRTVATALAGDTTSSSGALMKLDFKPASTTITADLLTGKNSLIDDAMIAQTTIAVSSPNTAYNFVYTLGTEDHCETCVSTNYCKTCEYDLEISIRDEDNNLASVTITPGGSTCSAGTNPIVCVGIPSASYTFNTTLVNVGTYTVTKTLKLNQASIVQYYADMVEAFKPCANIATIPVEPCLNCDGLCLHTHHVTTVLVGSVLEYHYLYGAQGVISTATADSIADCLRLCGNPATGKTDCELKFSAMKEDMSPGGQYFDNRNLSNNFSPSPNDNSWLTANVSGVYTNFYSDFASWRTTNSCGAGLSITSWTDVRNNWQTCFADYLALYHPEYCAYEFNCVRDLCPSASGPTIVDANDFDMNEVVDFATKNYYNPTALTHNVTTTTYSNYVGSSDGAYNSGTQVSDPYFAASTYSSCSTMNDLSVTNCGGGTTTDESNVMNYMLQHYAAAGTTTTPVYISIWYILDDPDNLHSKVDTAAASGAGNAAGIHIPNNVFEMIKSLHGDGTAAHPGLFGGVHPIMTKYQYFGNAYEGIKKLVQYKRFASTYLFQGTVPPAPYMKCNGYTTTTSTNPGYSSSGFAIHYPVNDIYEAYWNNACKDATGNVVTSSGFLAAMQSLTGTGNTDVLEAYKGNCSSYASQWIAQWIAACPTVILTSDTIAIKNYLISICANASDPIHSIGGTTSPVGVSGALGTFTTFNQVRDAYATSHGGTCTSTIVHPPLSVINDQVNCSCGIFNQYLADNSAVLGSATNAVIADSVNNYYQLSGSSLVTGTDVGNWKTECALTSHTLANLTNMPPLMLCSATPMPTYNANTCTCSNLNDYITTLNFDYPSGATDAEIATNLNLDFSPTTTVTSTMVAAWKAACAAGTATASTFTDLPPTLKCLNQAECTGATFMSFVVNHGFPGLPHTYTSTEKTDIATAINNGYVPVVTVTSTDVGVWLTACSTNTFTTSTFANLPVDMQCSANGIAPPPCACEQEYLQAVADAQYQYDVNVLAAAQVLATNFINAYKIECLNFATGRETFTVAYSLNEFYYTLYYYDQAGNLIKTVPPQGVELLSTSTSPSLANVAAYRAGTYSTYSVPAHKMVTHYWYNSLQQLVKQFTPDADTSYFYYDILGRMVVSQNTKQSLYTTPGYSYTIYDTELGRIIEVGELFSSDATIKTKTRTPSDLSAWLTAAVATKHEVTRTFYDSYLNSTINGYFGSLGQENLRNRVSTVTFTDGSSTTVFNRATHYSYDIHGNVKTMIQDVVDLETPATISSGIHSFGLKYIDYEYDLVSGKVNKVLYQNHPNSGRPQFDRFYHMYLYDADNRITQALSSRDNIIWEKEAKYFYYKHGPLARVEIGDKQVQGLDYAYTIQGWIKAVNSTILDNTRDEGHDGQQVTNLNKLFGPDVMSYALRYFSGDYIPKNTSLNAVIATTNSLIDTDAPSLYNGNISEMSSTITDLSNNSLPQINAYKYDQLNRIRIAHSYNSMSGNAWNPSSYGGKYAEVFHYDYNGNITRVSRKDDAAAQLDLLDYHYYDASSNYIPTYPSTSLAATITNKLSHVDGDSPTANTTDIESQSASNYKYDKIGNLVYDAQENIDTIAWSVYGKIQRIKRSPTNTKDDLEFAYDATGNRIRKTDKIKLGTGVLKNEVDWKNTYYVRDAQGNVMATYDQTYALVSGTTYKEVLTIKEQDIYGSSRLGVRNGDAAVDTISRRFTSTGFSTNAWTYGKFLGVTYTMAAGGNPPAYNTSAQRFSRKIGLKQYELVNHLGNVLATVSDRKTAINTSGSIIDSYKSNITNSQDYYSFGMVMPSRSYTSGGYRYGFNGKENDNEVKGQGNQQDYGYRIYDPRLGKFLSVDPLTRTYPMLTPYQFASNRPIDGIDRDGLEFSTPMKEKEYIPVQKADDVAYNIMAFLSNGCIIQPYNLLYNTSAGSIDATTRVSTTVVYSTSEGFYYGATGKTLKSFACAYGEDGFELIDDPESSENLKKLAKATVSLELGEAEIPGMPTNPVANKVAEDLKGAAIDKTLDVILPEKTEAPTTTKSSSTTTKAPATPPPAWAPSDVKDNYKKDNEKTTTFSSPAGEK